MPTNIENKIFSETGHPVHLEITKKAGKLNSTRYNVGKQIF